MSLLLLPIRSQKRAPNPTPLHQVHAHADVLLLLEVVARLQGEAVAMGEAVVVDVVVVVHLHLSWFCVLLLV